MRIRDAAGADKVSVGSSSDGGADVAITGTAVAINASVSVEINTGAFLMRSDSDVRIVAETGIMFQTGDGQTLSLAAGTSDSGVSGNVVVRTADANATGSLLVLTGTATNGASGDISIISGDATGGDSGTLLVSVGASATADGGDVSVIAGAGAVTGGNVVLQVRAGEAVALAQLTALCSAARRRSG